MPEVEEIRLEEIKFKGMLVSYSMCMQRILFLEKIGSWPFFFKLSGFWRRERAVSHCLDMRQEEV